MKVSGYSPTQVALHWIVVFLVAFQFVAHARIERDWIASINGELPSENVLTFMHIGAGVAVLVLAAARIYLRVTRGAPSPPADEPRLLQLLSETVHGLLYLLLLLLPVTGSLAWFLGIEGAGQGHRLMTNLLLAAIALHVAGALFQHFIRRSAVLMRMFRPEQS